MPKTQVRVVGSGFSTFLYNNQSLAWLEAIKDSGQTVLGGASGAGWEAIQPLGLLHAQEVVTGRYLNPGTLSVVIRELWNQWAWEQMQGLAGTNNLAEVFAAMAAMGTITCQFIIKPPGSSTWRGNVFNNCTVTYIDDSETVGIGSLSIARRIDLLYTHKTPFTGAAGTPTT
jgi:hypothetical protein